MRFRLILIVAAFINIAVFLASSRAVDAQRPKLTQSEPRDASGLKPPSVPFAPGPVVPGLRENAIPQGVVCVPAKKRLIVSHYFDDGPSCLSVLGLVSGRLVASIALADASGKPHKGHVGGIAALGDAVFVASDGQVMKFDLEVIVSNKPPAIVSAVSSRKCETQASFCTATKDLLLVGEFAYGGRYPTHASHHLKDRKGVRKYAWVCGYDAADPLGDPKCVLSVRQRVQGMCVAGNRIFLSLSYGRRNRSTIVVYRNPIGEAPHRTVQLTGGAKVPLWMLDGDNYLGKIDFPPMSEGITMIGGRLAVLSESGAQKYLPGGKGPLDRILLLDVSRFR